MTNAVVRAVMAAAIVGATATVVLAQATSTAMDTKTFEVLMVDGNQLVVRLPEGTRELTVADDFRFTVNGQQLSVRQLKPGMNGTATITTRTTVTPVTVTEVKNGTVAAQTGMSIIVRTDEGIKSFTQSDVDKRGVKILREGKPAQISDFRQGDRLSATIITSLPPTVVTEQQVQATLAAAPAATPRPAAASSGSAAASSGSASSSRSAAASATPSAARTLPKTASAWPTLALASALLLAIGFTLTLRRRLER